MLRGLSIKAVLIGVALDWLLSIPVGLIIGVSVVLYVLAVRHESLANPNVVNALIKGNTMCAASCVVGGLASMLTGFVTGWIARSNRIKNALAAGVFSTVSSAILLPLMNGYPMWFFPLNSVLTVVGCTLGGVIAHGMFGETATTETRPV